MKSRQQVALAASLFSMVILGGCDTRSPESSEPPADAAGTERMITGQEAYERVCAECHESGAGGAPRTGDASAWADRSSLWEAVLFKHATEGYLDMPADGGDETLTDPVVEAAAEYMLLQTNSSGRPDAED